MSKALELEGQRFGRLIVLRRTESKRISDRHTVTMWVCLCDCGNTKVIRSDSLKSGRVRSCGCLFKEQLIQRVTKHGMTNTRIYNAWQNMKRRCYDPSSAEYKNYGGRGIILFLVYGKWL